jgi:RHS repeat-associated protein
MDWDFADNLKQVDLGGGGTAYYVYDGSGNRVRKVIINGSSKKERLYIGDFEIYRDYTSNVLQTERETVNISDDQKRFLQIETLTVDNGTPIVTPTAVFRYQYDNHLGSACLELDSSAQIITYEEYHPFGTSSYRSGRSAAEASLKRYRYSGKERDDETGLYYYGARYCASWLGRFVSADPKEIQYFTQSTYVLSANNPVGLVDVNGEGPGDNIKKMGGNRYFNDPSAIDNEVQYLPNNPENGDSFTFVYDRNKDQTITVDYIFSEDTGWEWRARGARNGSYGGEVSLKNVNEKLLAGTKETVVGDNDQSIKEDDTNQKDSELVKNRSSIDYISKSKDVRVITAAGGSSSKTVTTAANSAAKDLVKSNEIAINVAKKQQKFTLVKALKKSTEKAKNAIQKVGKIAAGIGAALGVVDLVINVYKAQEVFRNKKSKPIEKFGAAIKVAASFVSLFIKATPLGFAASLAITVLTSWW